LGIGWGRETRALAYDEERRPPAAGGSALGGATAVVDGRVRRAVVGAGEQRIRAGRHRRRRRGAGSSIFYAVVDRPRVTAGEALAAWRSEPRNGRPQAPGRAAAALRNEMTVE